STPGVERPWLSKAEGFILPNHDTGRILPAESQRSTTDLPVVVIDSLETKYDSADESSVCSTLFPPLEKPGNAEPISGLKTIKTTLKSISTFKIKALKGIIPNEPYSALAQENKKASASKSNSAPAENSKNAKTTNYLHVATVIKELNDLKLNVNKNQSSQSRDKQVLFCMVCGKTDHKTYDHADYMCTINMSQHLKSLGRSSLSSKYPRPSKCFFLPCTHYGSMDHIFDDCLYYPICRICGSYDHETNGHNKIISLERKINPRNPQHPFKRCEVCGSSIHTITDHYDIEWFKKGEALQAKKAEDQKKDYATKC
ncbi:hypothetical protein Tco_1252070, partial [Tanacetum coccineum]